MTTTEIANHLVELCRKGDFETAQKDLFSEDAVSIEPHETPAFDKETKGLDAILEKGKNFKAMVEKTHSISVSDPIITANSFACLLNMNVTMKGQRSVDMKELCVYEVKDGEIVSEHFFM